MDVKGGIFGGSTKFDKGRGYLRPHTLTSSSIYRRGSVFFIFFLLREVFGYGSSLCLRFSSPLVLASTVIRELQRCWVGEGALVETVHICSGGGTSVRRIVYLENFALVQTLENSGEGGTILAVEIYITQLAGIMTLDSSHPTLRYYFEFLLLEAITSKGM